MHAMGSESHFGEDLALKQERARKQLVEELISEKTSLDEIEKNKRRLLSSLYELNIEMKKVNKEKTRLMDEMYMAETKSNRVNRIIEGIESKIQQGVFRLKLELRTVLQIADQGALRLLFSSKTSNEFDRDLKFLRLLIDRNYKGIKEYKRLVNLHTEQKQILKNTIEKLTQIKERIKKKEQYVTLRQQEKRRIITKMEQKSRLQLSSIGSLKEKTKSIVGDSEELDEQLAALLQTSFFENKGRFAPPLEGSIIQDYGPNKDENFNVVIASKGQTWASPAGRKVRSIYNGIVEFAGKIKNFGKTLIIDHGDHYYTVYSNLGDILVEPGDRVATGQRVASVGILPADLGTGIYFEIRHFSEPENPNYWLRASGNEEVP